jgi:diacylglycerol kinase family enzyme
VLFGNKFPTLEISDGDEDHTARFAIVANGHYYGGDYRVSGPGLLTSGEFETILVERVSDLLRPDVFAGILARRPLNRSMRSFTSTEVHARSPGAEVPVQLDGELWGGLPMSFRIEAGALNVVR